MSTRSDANYTAISSIHGRSVYNTHRRKTQATSSYIYETLFKRGVNHDVIICALGKFSPAHHTANETDFVLFSFTGKEWKLHRIYLCQVKVKAYNIMLNLCAIGLG